VGRLQPAPWSFNDTFTNYNEPDIGMAAVASSMRPASACARAHAAADARSSPRPAGWARALAQANAERSTSGGAGERISFSSQAVLSAVREDLPALLRGEAQRKAQVVGEACLLFEEYVEREWAAGRLSLNLKSGPATSCSMGTVTRNRWVS
jgi:hypothetical protein